VNGVRATPSVSVPVCAVTSVVPVCVVSTCVYTSMARCVLRRTHRARVRRCVRGASSVSVTPSETPSTSEPPCASGVVASVPECVLPGTPCVKGAPQAEETAGAGRTARVCEPPCAKGAPQVEETTCAREAARVCEPPCVCEARCAKDTPRVSAPAGVCVYEARCVSDRPCVVRVTACVRSLYTREMTVAMHDHAAASPGVGLNVECSLGVVTCRGVRREWQRRLQLWRNKCRVAAVVAFGTVPGLHGRAQVVRAVPRTRPPRARLRGLRPGPETHAVSS